MEDTSEPKVLEITEREWKEIKHALFYTQFCNHGTTGHNQLGLIAKMATHLGFALPEDLEPVMSLPEGITITPEKQ